MEDRTNISETLRVFKFRSGSDKDIENLENNQVWFSTFDILNDPFDGAYSLEPGDITPKLLQRFLTKRYQTDPDPIKSPRTEAKQQIRDHIKNGTFDEYKSYAFELIEKEIAKVKSDISVFCLSAEGKSDIPNDDFPPPLSRFKMWAHYADSFKGYCIEYDFKKLIESLIDSTGNQVHSRGVHYTDDNELPRLTCSEIMERYIDEPNSEYEPVLKALSTKQALWSEEQEVRLLSYGSSGLHRITPYCINRIFISDRCPKETSKRINKYCEEHSIKKFKVGFHKKTYSLGFGAY
jgi:hypothetical protein